MQQSRIQKRTKELNDLQQQIRECLKEAVEIHIDELKQQKQALETALKTAKKNCVKYNTEKTQLSASIKTLQSRLDAAGEAATLQEEEVLARRARWQQEKQRLSGQRNTDEYCRFCKSGNLSKSHCKTGEYLSG